MSIELKIAFTALTLFFLTAPIGFFGIGKKWFRWGMLAHWGPLAVSCVFFAAFVIRKVWQ